jgi:hypothetical protein
MELEACIPSLKPTLAQPSMEASVLESVCFSEASLTTLSPAQAHSQAESLVDSRAPSRIGLTSITSATAALPSRWSREC